VRLVWAQHALADRDEIFSRIEAENPRAAINIDDQIVSATRRLLDFPESGRPGRVAGTRELVIPRTPYIAAYRERRCGSVLRILHGAQAWPDDIELS
jgi:addiction module RelE/StbE family toxin